MHVAAVLPFPFRLTTKSDRRKCLIVCGGTFLFEIDWESCQIPELNNEFEMIANRSAVFARVDVMVTFHLLFATNTSEKRNEGD